MSKKKISPSMMCADIRDLAGTIAVLEETGVDYLHVDIMDGVFVRNYTFGTDFCRILREMTRIPLDIHLMITEPEAKIDWFKPEPGDYVSVHAESTRHLHRALSAVKSCGAKAMAALNPATPLNALDYVLDEIDGVLVMTVNPGFAGQKLIPPMIGKIADTRKYLDSRGYTDTEIAVDGNVSFGNIAAMAHAGADIFVCGSSSAFAKSGTVGENIRKIRLLTEEE